MTEHHDDGTMTKVFDVLHEAGFGPDRIEAAINGLQNAGILFRERTDTRPIEARLREYVDVNSAGLATVRALLDSGRVPPGEHATALRGHIEFWARIAGDLEMILAGDELEFTVNEYLV